ncbi:hypothetical protein KRR39_01915 [Nocardioides panacis]|uniref:Uncharacterized protein n=1 Tax=Nocardioides panacis TaxID=2849501 RepID=A0A975Y0T1_9ACTN|nr:hypothetical protein [Nocardioides panacis]QWZ08644.1 hypothetical protein KRR39_01915 [Nocardioides panacis]
MSYERLWERLLKFLNGWAVAAEVEPGRIEVTVPNPEGSAKAVEILMTPGQWDELVTVPWGDFDSAAREVRKAVLGVSHHERFLVYAQYELVPSATPTLTGDPALARLRELARQHPEGFGHWVVTDRTGKVLDESHPPPD